MEKKFKYLSRILLQAKQFIIFMQCYAMCKIEIHD